MEQIKDSVLAKMSLERLNNVKRNIYAHINNNHMFVYRDCDPVRTEVIDPESKYYKESVEYLVRVKQHIQNAAMLKLSDMSQKDFENGNHQSASQFLAKRRK